VRDWAEEHRTEIEARNLQGNVEVHLQRMSALFVNADFLLKSIGMTILVFHFFRLLDKVGRVSKIHRMHFELFDTARQANRLQAAIDITQANYDLLEFDKYVQTPNDEYATRIRLSIMVKYMREVANLDLPETHDEYFARKP
jgi:hypothetical protein